MGIRSWRRRVDSGLLWSRRTGFPAVWFLVFLFSFSLSRKAVWVYVCSRTINDDFLFYFEEFCFVLAWHGGLAFEFGRKRTLIPKLYL